MELMAFTHQCQGLAQEGMQEKLPTLMFLQVFLPSPGSWRPEQKGFCTWEMGPKRETDSCCKEK